MKNIFRTKSDDQLILIDVEKDTQNFTKIQTQEAIEKGRDVANNHPPTSSEELQHSPVAMIIHSSYTSKLVELGVLFSKKIEYYRTQYQQLLEAFKSDSEFQSAQTELANLKEEAADSLHEAVEQYEASISDTKTLWVWNQTLSTNGDYEAKIRPSFTTIQYFNVDSYLGIILDH
mgnify:CR=1 FL=1